MISRDYAFGFTHIAKVHIDNFTFFNHINGELWLSLIEVPDPELFVFGPRTVQPWQKRGDVYFGVAVGSYTLSGDDKSTPCTVEVRAEPALVVMQGRSIYFVGLPGSLDKFVFAIETMHETSGYEE